MEGNGRPIPRDPGESPRGPSLDTPPGTGRNIAVLVFLLMLVPVLAAALVFPALRSQPFALVSEIDPAQVKWIKVQLVNRTELDGGADVGPFYADPSDHAKLLDALKDLKPVEAFGGAKGPWLGDYRVMLTNGRRATLKLYWHRSPSARPTAPATLRMQIDDGHRFEGGTTAAVVAAATEAEARGRPNP